MKSIDKAPVTASLAKKDCSIFTTKHIAKPQQASNEANAY